MYFKIMPHKTTSGWKLTETVEIRLYLYPVVEAFKSGLFALLKWAKILNSEGWSIKVIRKGQN